MGHYNTSGSAAEAIAFDYNEAFSRNAGLFSEEEQATLRAATVAIPGMGGVGGIHLMTLARMGIGGFHIADEDTFALANFNRQYGANVLTIGKPKIDVMAEAAYRVNPGLRLRSWPSFIDDNNVEEFLDGVDIVVDSVDAFAIPARRTLYDCARRRGIPVISAGPLGFSCSMLVFTPTSLSFDSYFDTNSEMPLMEQFARFIFGVAPRPSFLSYLNTKRVDGKQQRGPSVSSAVTLCAGFAATEVAKLLLRRGVVRAVPYYHYFDPFLMEFKVGHIRGGNRNWFRKLKFKFFLRRLFPQK